MSQKKNDKKVIAWLQSIGKQCKVADELIDKQDKYNIVVWSKKLGTMRIDTKYTTRPESKLFYEVEKHRNSAANFIWYFMCNNGMESFLVKKDVLKKLAANRKQYQARSDGDWLVDFSINDLRKGVDYWKISNVLKM